MKQVMLDNEMIVSMLRHVVAGLSFLHSAEPPIIHQELRSPKVLLDSSCRAHLSDFQQHTVRPWLLPSSKHMSTAANCRYMASSKTLNVVLNHCMSSHLD